MALRTMRVGTGLMLVASGALMYAASWQRWAGACGWGQAEGDACLSRQDHRFDFVAPTVPWEPVGSAAQLAGASLLVLAIAFALLPWALIGRRPGRIATVVLAGAVLVQVAVGAATLASGLSGSVVRPVTAALAVYLWLLWPPALLARFAVSSRGWTLATCIALALGTPLVAAVSYAVGPYDAQPWWEAISGGFTATAGLCLLGAAVFGRRSESHDETDTVASPALVDEAAARD